VGLTEEQTREIKGARGTQRSTRRTVSGGLENILHEAIPVLDHGFIRVVDYMGDDSSVVQAARVSYGKGTRRQSEDRSLINYLMRHAHTTPFEMAEIKLHVKLPIFVARQWIRHRTASVNEYSARYSVLDREFYVPAAAHLAAQSVTNKQGRQTELSGREADKVLSIMQSDAVTAYDHYLELLNEDENGNVADPRRLGLARELARINLSVNFYTQWYWKINLHNLMGFLRLRADPHAQYEIRAYADVLLDILKKWVPLTAEAFIEHQLGAVRLSATAIKVIKARLAGEHIAAESSGLSKREWDNLAQRFGL
jgi:thymidylate synthase (FAD)